MMLDRDIANMTFLTGFTPALQVLNAGYEDFKTRKPAFQPRVQSYYILHTVLSGKGTFRTGGRTYALTGGDMFMCFPQEEICYFADKNEPYRYVWFMFEGDDAEHICQTLRLSRTGAVSKGQNIAQVFKLFAELFEMDNPSAVRIISVFYAVIAALEGEGHPNPFSRTNEFAVRIRRYIENNFMQPELKITHIAESLNISHVYLCKVFKKAQGISAAHYLKQYRLSRAYDLLLSGGCTVTEAMFDTGYTDISYFSKTFKEKYGFSPGKMIRK